MSVKFLLIGGLIAFGLLWLADPIADLIARLFPRVSDEADKAIRDALDRKP